LIVLEPIKITEFVSSNVPENDELEWVSTTAYVVGDRCMVLDTHKIYECQVDNTDKYPPDYLDDGDSSADPVVPSTWKEVSATNRWKMFDGKTQSATTQTNDIIVSFTPGELFNGLALLDISAESVTIKVTDPEDGEVYNQTVDMLDYTDITDYYPWFFYPMVKKSVVVKLDLPAYSSASVEITLADPGETVRLGELIVGTQKDIGKAVFGTSVGLADYSQKSVDSDTGEITLEEGVYNNTVDFRVEIDTNKVYDVRRFLAKYRATPVLYVGHESFQATVIYGFYKDLSIVLSNLAVSSCSLEVEELS
jgi:hypothetical protein